MYLLAKKIDLSSYLINKIEGNSPNILTANGGLTFQDIKEKVCYCALELKEDFKKAESYKYELPNGTYITTKEERINKELRKIMISNPLWGLVKIISSRN